MNSRDVIVVKKILQYADEIRLTIMRFNLDRDAFYCPKCNFNVYSSDW